VNYQIITLSQFIIAGYELKTTWVNYECAHAIPLFWNKVMSENLLNLIPNKSAPDVVLGMYTNYSNDFSLTSGHYSLIIGCPVKDIANVDKNNVVIKEIPQSKYAVFSAKGPFDKSVGNVWLNEIWKNTEIKRTFTYDFEWYDSKSTNDENSIVKIYISIE